MMIEITQIIMTVMVSVAVTVVIMYNVMPRIYPILRLRSNEECMYVCTKFDAETNKCTSWEKICWKERNE
jgi:hypothetical protein